MIHMFYPLFMKSLETKIRGDEQKTREFSALQIKDWINIIFNCFDVEQLGFLYQIVRLCQLRKTRLIQICHTFSHVKSFFDLFFYQISNTKL